MRFLSSFIILGIFVLSIWGLWNYNDNFHDAIASYVENGEFLTLEARFTPEQIMKAHEHELIADRNRSFQPPSLKFYPYLFMDVKYTDANKQTREGVLLWSLIDGEMVLNTDSWETTHGFEDALVGNATRSDFIIMQALAKNQKSLTREQLQAIINAEAKTVDQWIEGALQKHFIVQEGDQFFLHIQDPKILVSPKTELTQSIVTKPYNHVQRVSKRFTRSQVENIANGVFGDDFTIRESQEVFLPVYRIEVLNPDGSILTSYWNALNGKRIDSKQIALN